MSIFQHLLMGTYYGEDVWMTGVHSNGGAHTPTQAHTAWVAACHEIWSPGSVGNAGWASASPAGSVAVQAVTYQIADGLTKKISRQQTALNIAGADPGDGVSFQVAPFILLDTAQGLSLVHGRMYLPPPSTGGWDSGRLDATRFALLGSCISKALIGMWAAGIQPVVFNQRTLGISEITDIRVSNKCATRHSRADAIPVYQKTHIFP